jgi:hypothetical protein
MSIKLSNNGNVKTTAYSEKHMSFPLPYKEEATLNETNAPSLD